MGFEHPDYDDVRPLAKGGMAEVYRARHVALDRPVAIKVMLEGGDAEGVTRMLQEARLVARLRHPNLVHVYDVGTLPGGRPYVVMECIEGATLASCAKPMSVGTALTLVGQIAAALGTAHEVGVVHRDVKPSNVLLDGSADAPFAKLADFGIARTEDSDITDTGIALGTPAYMAPEGFRGESFPASDVYGLGMILYELLTGERPFRARTAAAWMAHHLDPQRPSLPNDLAVPASMHRLFDRMVALDPEDRPQDGHAVVRELRDVLSDIDPTLSIPVSVTTRAVERPDPPSQTGTLSMTWLGVGAAAIGTGGLAIGGILLLLGIAVGASASLWMGKDEGPNPASAAPLPPEPPPGPPPAPDVEPEPAPPRGPEEAQVTDPAPPSVEADIDEPAPAPEPEPAPAASPPSAGGTPTEEPEAAEPEPEPVEDAVVVAEPEPEPEPEPPRFPGGTYRGEASGRPLTITLSGPGDAVTCTLELRVGAEVETRTLTGRAVVDGSSWHVELQESGGGWRLDGTLGRAFSGTLGMGKRALKVEASP